MKRKIIKSVMSLFVAALLINNITGCKKDDDKPLVVPTINQSNGIVFNPNLTYGTVTDIDGTVYKTITIGSKSAKATQTWMAENLKVIKYNNGDSIPSVTENVGWSNQTDGAYCIYENTSSNTAVYGVLYNWYAIDDSRNICPAGWHVPTDGEWTALSTILGGDSIAGGKMKETGTTHWVSPNEGATNESGFTAVPSGFRNYAGAFGSLTYYNFWWSATEASISNAYYRGTACNHVMLNNADADKRQGFSVRCLKD